MSWLKAIFSRTPPATPRLTSTGYGDTIRKLASADDPEERARLAGQLAVQLEGAFDSSADNVQVAIWQLGEQLREGQGETNDMISEAVSLIRGQGAELSAARADFREIAETVSDIQLWRADVDADRESFKQSRAASIEERRTLFAQYEESKQDRAKLHEQLTELSSQVEQLSGQIAQVLAERRRGEP